MFWAPVLAANPVSQVCKWTLRISEVAQVLTADIVHIAPLAVHRHLNGRAVQRSVQVLSPLCLGRSGPWHRRRRTSPRTIGVGQLSDLRMEVVELFLFAFELFLFPHSKTPEAPSSCAGLRWWIVGWSPS